MVSWKYCLVILVEIRRTSSSDRFDIYILSRGVPIEEIQDWTSTKSTEYCHWRDTAEGTENAELKINKLIGWAGTGPAERRCQQAGK